MKKQLLTIDTPFRINASARIFLFSVSIIIVRQRRGLGMLLALLCLAPSLEAQTPLPAAVSQQTMRTAVP